MTTITALPQPATVSVVLTVTPTGTVTSIMRTDANGTNPVRTQAGLLPTASPFVVTDNEATLTGPILYTVQDGGAGASVTTALNVDGQVWLTVPVAPGKSLQVELNTNAQTTRASLSTVHEVIDRADPIVTLAPLKLRTGTLELWCSTYEQGRALEQLYDRGDVVQLRQDVPGLDMYHVTTQTSLTPASDTSPRRWFLGVDFQEVAYPLGNQVGTLGWDFNDVAAAYSTFTAVQVTYATFNDLTIGPLP
jgi:hypothetical protein